MLAGFHRYGTNEKRIPFARRMRHDSRFSIEQLASDFLRPKADLLLVPGNEQRRKRAASGRRTHFRGHALNLRDSFGDLRVP